MSRENEKVTLTLESLSIAMALAAGKQVGFDTDWAENNWRDFLPAAILVKENIGIDQVVACDYCYVVYSAEASKCPNCGEVNKS